MNTTPPVLRLDYLEFAARDVAAAKKFYTAAFGCETAANIPDFANRVLTTSQGWWLIVVGCGVGFLFALVVLVIGVVSLPMLRLRSTSTAYFDDEEARRVKDGIASLSPKAGKNAPALTRKR